MPKAIVIGGTAGIGQSIIKGLIEAGYAVHFTYNSNGEQADTIRRQYGEQCTCSQLDLGSLDAVSAFLTTIDSASAPDVLVNSAGMSADALSLGDVRARLEHATTINYMAPVIIACHIGKLMTGRRSGTIVNITSIAAKRPKAGNAIYGSAKAALERFTATLALEVARFKVRTLCVSPGFVDTPMFHKFSGANARDIVREMPTREILTADQVAETVLLFVKGQIKSTGTTLVLGNGELVF
ncbi:short-chain dehydrogenase [Duganella sp. Leaf126]|uniref:SDR family NAD(P)-dependent oxidoreductase n=1 Tax=Duganella sp. Leaf126 TaxID=1736266 RepID=UPI0006FAD5E5|nr:SDR family oxidoreductase [Duganella sp. Leaf126]KQQ33006.1 short-chain dehydrogenase [Duganella sp. Leaf126]